MALHNIYDFSIWPTFQGQTKRSKLNFLIFDLCDFEK
jgi:hypothetical protein